MKALKLLFVSSFILSSLTAFASVKVIYGEDNRVDVKDSDNAMFRELARSTAGMIPASNLSSNGSETTISASSMASRGMCSSERFAQQITAANCSGFLVGEDLLVTAGHCIRSMSDCSRYRWVFDYAYTSEAEGSVNVPTSSVYKCTSIVERSLNRSTQDDYALVKLDRKVTDRRVLEVRSEGKPAVNDPLVVIGHPTGLPTKIADGANIRSLRGTYFVANLDTYGGNSGSAVFNAETGVVEGILVRGETDYRYDGQRGCRVSNVVSDNGGRGEDVTYITNIRALKN